MRRSGSAENRAKPKNQDTSALMDAQQVTQAETRMEDRSEMAR